MISRYLQWRACQRLAKLVRRNRESFRIQDFAKRRAAMLKVTRA